MVAEGLLQRIFLFETTPSQDHSNCLPTFLHWLCQEAFASVFQVSNAWVANGLKTQVVGSCFKTKTDQMLPLSQNYYNSTILHCQFIDYLTLSLGFNLAFTSVDDMLYILDIFLFNLFQVFFSSLPEKLCVKLSLLVLLLLQKLVLFINLL